MTRVLLVEDDNDVRQMVYQILTRDGYDVQQTCNGREALDAFREQPADLVITDLIMPEKEGLEMIRDLVSEFGKVKIIAISGGGRLDPGDYLRTARVFGAKKTIHKPFGRTELLDAVKEVMES